MRDGNLGIFIQCLFIVVIGKKLYIIVVLKTKIPESMRCAPENVVKDT